MARIIDKKTSENHFDFDFFIFASYPESTLLNNFSSMTKMIGLKELQKNTKRIRLETAKGTSFIVIYRSKPIFEIRPLEEHIEFADDLKKTGLYNLKFISGMEEAEKNIKDKKIKSYSAEEFLQSLSA